MSSTRTAPRTTNMNKTSTSALNTHHTNGSANVYDVNDSAVNSSNITEFDGNPQRSASMKNQSSSDGIYRNNRFIHAVTVGLLGQPVVVQTNEQERYHGILDTISANGDVVLLLVHRMDNTPNDILSLSTSLIDLFETADSSMSTFELQKKIISASNIIEMIAADIDLTGNGKCMLEEAPKVTQLEDDRFSRMEHFYGSDELDPDTLEDLELGDDGKIGYDPEDMFHTNREKFNTGTDYDESKYTNVPLRQLTVEESAEIDRKALEIERGPRPEEVDEDDSGVKRPSKNNQTHQIDDGNSNSKNNQTSRMHSGVDRRSEIRYDSEYNPPKRGNGRDQQRSGGGNNRRGGQNNYPTNNSKSNQRSDQPQYSTTRSSEQTSNNRPPQQYKQRSNNRYGENLSSHEGRDSPSQTTNDETARSHRMNSGSFSQGQNSGPTSPSTVSARVIYPRNSGPSMGRNSPAPNPGSSSSRNNSITTTSPPPLPHTSSSAAPTSSYQTNTTTTTTTGNYSQQSTNKNNKKPPRNEHQLTNEDIDQPKQQRNQQPNSSNNQSNTTSVVRPSQLHTQQMKQQQTPSSNTNVPPPLALPNQDDHSSSHEIINPNQSDPTIHVSNPPVYTPSVATTSNLIKGSSGLNPEADEFVPGPTRESNSRPESRGAPTGPVPMNPYVMHSYPQTFHLLQQQQQQVQPNQTQQSPMIPQNPPAIYPPYYSTQFPNMSQFINAAPQQMGVGMMGAPMIASQTQQQLPGNGSNTTNPNTGGMTTPNGGVGPTYKPNTNPTHSGDAGNSSMGNVAPKKAVVSVQRVEQSNVPQQQQQQVTGAPSMTYPAPPLRFFSPEYMPQQTTQSPMHLSQIQFCYPYSSSSIIQTTTAPVAGVGTPQNIMIPSAGASGGPSTQTQPQIFYSGPYQDPRFYGIYPPTTSINPGGVNPTWQMARSPPQQQPSDQQRPYGGAQNIVPQATSSGAPNTTSGSGGGRSTSTSGPSGQTGAGGPPMAPQYALSGNVSAAYSYPSNAAWYPAQSQISSPQSTMPPQINHYSMMFDSSQQAPPQQATYVHTNQYESAYFQQAQPPQQGLDSVPTGNYNR